MQDEDNNEDNKPHYGLGGTMTNISPEDWKWYGLHILNQRNSKEPKPTRELTEAFEKAIRLFLNNGLPVDPEDVTEIRVGSIDNEGVPKMARIQFPDRYLLEFLKPNLPKPTTPTTETPTEE